MEWKKVPPEMAALLERALPGDPRVEQRKMFGMPCSFANGHLYVGCFEDRLILKLREGDHAEFLRLKGAEPFSPMGRTMREYVLVPRTMHADLRALREWVRAGFDYVTSLPPKMPKPKKTPAKKAAAKKSAPKPAGKMKR